MGTVLRVLAVVVTLLLAAAAPAAAHDWHGGNYPYPDGGGWTDPGQDPGGWTDPGQGSTDPGQDPGQGWTDPGQDPGSADGQGWDPNQGDTPETPGDWNQGSDQPWNHGRDGSHDWPARGRWALRTRPPSCGATCASARSATASSPAGT